MLAQNWAGDAAEPLPAAAVRSALHGLAAGPTADFGGTRCCQHRIASWRAGQCTQSLSEAVSRKDPGGRRSHWTTVDAKMVRSIGELEAAFQEMEKDRPNAVIVQPSPPSKLAAALALKYRI
jgi:hypothetical protein